MFKFFKEKIKSWIKKSEKKIEEEAEEVKEEIEETPKVEKEAKKIEEIKKEEIEKPKEKVEELEKKKVEKVEIKEEKEEIIEEIEPIKRTAPTPEQVEKEIAEGKKPGIFKKLTSAFKYKISESDFESIFENLELLLLENNVAVEAVDKIKKELSQEIIGKEIKKQQLEKEIKDALRKSIDSLLIEPDDIPELIKEKFPFVIVFFGINGTGKTTTIAKFAKMLQNNNISSVLAAGDTFRAASIEQLQKHADKLKIKLIKHDYNADPAAVAFDAIKHAKAHNLQAVLIDTAGRMHTSKNLMKEMEKICRVTDPDLKIFVAESIAGNDAIEQAKSFKESVGIDGSILSKVDIDKKGGTAISISYVTKRPIFFLGTGQNYQDLEVFNKEKFIEKLGL
jgi:fused signal recognition particle receptor